MRLKFVGKDGSLRLTRGKIYEVELSSTAGHIWVHWGHESFEKCPYSTPQSFAANWVKP